jgi:hypothetical protein
MLKLIYWRIWELLPERWRGRFTYLIFAFKIKPLVNKRVKSPFTKGIIILSADFEMAWAFRYSKNRSGDAEEMGLHERKNIPLLLSLFEKYKTPVTWATVGHLFLESCNKEVNSLAHPEMPRPVYFENSNWLFAKNDWYDADPCTDHKTSPAWYAPDLIDNIILSPVQHEIGCHTFSHIDCSDKNCTPDLFKVELQACLDAAVKKGIKLKSMVFPGHTLGNYAMLKEMGFTSYRKDMKYHIDIPVVDNFGLVQIPSSFLLEKPAYNWTANICIRMASSFVYKAAQHKLVAHLWFHPSMNSWYLENVLPGVLTLIRKMEDEGRIEVITMEQMANRILLKN